MDKEQYISNTQDNFHRFIGANLSLIAAVEQLPQVTEEDKRAFDLFRQMLKGKDVREIEKSLSEGDAVKAIDKIAKFYKDLLDYALEHINESQIWKLVVKQATYQHIDNEKDMAKKQFEMLYL